MEQKNKIEVVIISLMIILFSSNVIFASNQQVLNLSEAINLVLKDNIELQIQKLELDNSKIDYEKSQAENLDDQSDSSKLEAEVNLLQAKNNFYQTQTTLINEVMNEYSEVILFKQKLKLTKREVELEKNLLDKVRREVKHGFNNNLELIDQKNEYNDALLDLEDLTDDYNQGLIDLKLDLGLKEVEDLQLEKWSVEEAWKIDKAEAVRVAIENSLDLKLKGKEVKLAQIELEKAKKISTPQLDLQELKNNLRVAKLEKINEKNELKTTVKKDYYSFKQAVKKIELKKEELIKAKQDYQLRRQEEEKGLKSADDLLAAKVDWLEAKYNYQSAIVDYYLTKVQLKIDMGLEVEVLVDEI